MKRGRGAPPWLAGLLIFAVAFAVWVGNTGGLRAWLRENALDRLLPALIAPPATQQLVTIVDIDRATLARLGPWPWPRATLARLVATIAEVHPAVIGIDILLSGSDRFSSDGDAELAETLAVAPSVLGFVLDSAGAGEALPATPVLTRGAPALPGIWRVPGVIGPAPALIDAAAGLGALAAAADPDGPIRRVPLLVLAGGVARPSLAVETVLIAREGSTLLIETGNMLRIGESAVRLGRDAQLRLIPPLDRWVARTISAASLLDDRARRAQLIDQIVLLGGSAPELGGLRVTPGVPATPSVWLHAAATAAILDGRQPVRPSWADRAETAGAITLAAFGLLLAAWLRPLPASLLALLAVLVWLGGISAAMATGPRVLLDPAGPPLLALAGFVVAALARFARDEWRARLLRASFEQHLAPEVVRRIAADPTALRLRGEMREITALFTDIEGFTAMTERAEPTDLVALLDAYFDATTRAITDQGGMIDKIVGDAIHAIFNAPFALDAHPQRAVAAALALLAASETVRASPLGQRLQLGRTRIGIETGPAIVGDVGGGRKLDYTAHGNAMNAAARLEAANKTLGSSICIGPGTAALLDAATIRPLGSMVLRGQSQTITVYTPVRLVADGLAQAAG